MMPVPMFYVIKLLQHIQVLLILLFFQTKVVLLHLELVLLLQVASNAIVDKDQCNFNRTEEMCGSSITLNAPNGYQTYTWTGPAPSTTVIGSSQSITVTQPGVYTLHNQINTSPCKSHFETITVVNTAGSITHPNY